MRKSLVVAVVVALMVVCCAAQSVAVQISPYWTGAHRSGDDGPSTLTKCTPYSSFDYGSPTHPIFAVTKGVIVFDLSQLKQPGQDLVSASMHYTATADALWMHLLGDIGGTPSIDTYPATSEYDPPVVTTYDSTTTSIDITNCLKADMASGYGYSTFTFMYISYVPGIHLDATFAPTPEPSSILALLTGLGALSGVMTRKRK